MELHGDKFGPGHQFLKREQWGEDKTYPWTMWAAICLVQGEWLYLKEGADFDSPRNDFRRLARRYALRVNLRFKASTKDLPKDEIKIVFWHHPENEIFKDEFPEDWREGILPSLLEDMEDPPES